MLLAIDVGNSNTVLAIFSGEELLVSWRLHTRGANTTDDWWIVINHLAESANVAIGKVDHVIISSVLPTVGTMMTQMSRRYLGVESLRVNSQLPMDLHLDVENPSSVGGDRICNMVAGRTFYGTPCIIVDLGTATTYDVVNEAGHFLGGAIAPGIETSAQQLFANAALLSAVELQVPDSVIGRNTETNLLSGIVYGAVAQIDGMIARIKQETGWRSPAVVITGGLGKLIANELASSITYDPDLTVKGLRLIYEACNKSG